mmetsp:Transcript_11610/g.32865  ORF Transcript_11610/g.32865 Transcript_11610/m.32865 type:complete len:210 (+) Transcript_11610:446-1075(+)
MCLSSIEASRSSTSQNASAPIPPCAASAALLPAWRCCSTQASVFRPMAGCSSVELSLPCSSSMHARWPPSADKDSWMSSMAQCVSLCCAATRLRRRACSSAMLATAACASRKAWLCSGCGPRAEAASPSGPGPSRSDSASSLPRSSCMAPSWSLCRCSAALVLLRSFCSNTEIAAWLAFRASLTASLAVEATSRRAVWVSRSASMKALR